MPLNRKEYQRTYQRQWIAKRRSDFFCDKLCVRCSSREKLELHHIDRETKIANSIWSWREERRSEEISKCEILCHSCHKLETMKQFGYKQYKHGTTTCYSETLCKCKLCRKAMADYKRQWRLSRAKCYGSIPVLETGGSCSIQLALTKD